MFSRPRSTSSLLNDLEESMYSSRGSYQAYAPSSRSMYSSRSGSYGYSSGDDREQRIADRRSMYDRHYEDSIEREISDFQSSYSEFSSDVYGLLDAMQKAQNHGMLDSFDRKDFGTAIDKLEDMQKLLRGLGVAINRIWK